jgi:3-hydroxyisobutyrate dehydrogenase-like beta-hydroxyacid dehydrogenase
MNDTRSTKRSTIAVLGTGKMGSAIATRFSNAGFDVVLWNRTRARAETLGIGTVADTPAAAVHDADFVVSSLTGPEAVRAAYVGPDGALAAGEGKRFAEMSTAGPDLVLELGALVTAAGGTLVDAPILGAPPVVRSGNASILLGGSDQDVPAASTILSMLGPVRHVGPLGSAARLKLAANSMLADVVLAAAELQVAGESAGLDPDDVFWVLTRIAPALEVRRRGFVNGVHTPPLFAVRDLKKDLNLALNLFASTGAVTPVTRVVNNLIEAAAEQTPDLDITAVTSPYRRAHNNSD